MESEESKQDTPCVSNLPVSTTAIPSGFLASASTAWTSRAGVLLDFHPPVLNSKNVDDNVAADMQATESRTTYVPGSDSVNAVAPGHRDTYHSSVHALHGLDSKNPKFNGPVQTDFMHDLHKDTSHDNKLPGALAVPYSTERSGYNSTTELETSRDAFEHHTAKEQAKLLQRYKQLKQQQKEQQEKLLRKQYQELEQLKSVQERVNNEIALQRQIQWGGSQTTGVEVQSRHSTSTASASSIKPSTIPQILANAAIKSSANGDTSGTSSHQTHRDFPPKQLMKPFIPQPSLPPEQEPEMYDSELDSVSDVPSSTMIEGVEPLPDTASELSDLPGEDKHSRAQPVVTMETIADNEESEERTLNETDGQVPDSPITNFDDLPVSSCLGTRVKTFEELLEEKLRHEEATDRRSLSPDRKMASTKPFLKKGDGIARFGMNKEAVKKSKQPPNEQPSKKKTLSSKQQRSSSAERQISKTRNDKPSSPVKKTQRISPKVSRKVATKTSTENSDPFKRPLPMKLKLNPKGGKPKKSAVTVTKDDDHTGGSPSSLEKVEPFNSTMEISFQNRMKELELQAETEKQELEEFELLEKAADNMSFSSNSSMVARMMSRQKLTTKASTIEEIVAIDNDRREVTQEKSLDEDELHASQNETRDDGDSSTEDEDDEDSDNDRTIGADSEKLDQSREQTSHTDFNDDESWGDFSQDVKDSEEDEESDEDGSSDHDDRKDDESIIAGSVPMRTSTPPVRKFPSHDSKSLITKETLKETASTPPTSMLMTKLFPQLKPVASKEQTQQQHQQQRQLQAVNDRPLGDGVQSKLLKEKLAELETEIERFRTENALLLKLREEREKAMKSLQKEMKDFEKYKNEELQRIEEYRDEEMKKIKKEKKIFEKYQKAARAMPDKKEREDIENLKRQVSELEDEMQRKESRWTSSSTRLRSKVDTLERENQELRDEIQVLEKRRLDAWKKDHAGRGKEKPRKKSQGKEKALSPETSKENTSPVVVNSKAEHAKSTSPELNSKDEHAKRTDRHREVYDGDLSQRLLYEMSLPEDTPRKLLPVTSPAKQSQLTTTATTLPSDASEFEGYNGEGADNPPRRRFQRKRAIKFDGNSDADTGYGLKPTVRTDSDESGDFDEIVHPDGKVECIYASGRRVITFTNGTRKEISQDGQTIVVSFFNGDIKQILPDQRVIYYYDEAKTTHTTYPDGLEVLQFPNKQIEKHYPDGTKEITFPDHTIKYLFPNGSEESIFPDGTVLRMEKNGDKTMEFPNGQREVHTPQYKKREYPDGTVKTVYPDGRQETRYSNGRIRVKDKDGRVIVDRVC
ncbi:centromere protein J-like isoform X2 [Ptychodera flava]|uniref:centromere protein J-like isoform X2 n=1 Tax=Ptychodera flava TaxID=63121 RepID=UPI00396AA4C7